MKRREDHNPVWGKPFLPVQLRMEHWAAILEAIEVSPLNTTEITEAYERLRAVYDRAVKHQLSQMV